MRVVAAIVGLLLIAVMLSEFFVAFMVPRRVKRDPRIARGLQGLVWGPWRKLARLWPAAVADTFLGFYGPLSLLLDLFVWVLGLMVGYGLLEWGVAGGRVSDRFLSSSGLFLSASASGGSAGLRTVELFEAATGVGVLFIVIGYMPAVYSAFSRREIAVSQLATRGGSPPSAGVLLHRAAGREHWKELERDLLAWEEWAAELMETHLSYPLLSYYRSQHVRQNWLAALTAMVDVAAFVKATAPEDTTEAADVTFGIGRHALADLAHQFRLEGVSSDRLSDEDFDHLYAIVERSSSETADHDTARRRLDHLRATYEPNAQALADHLALDLPQWVRHGEDQPADGVPARPSLSQSTRGR